MPDKIVGFSVGGIFIGNGGVTVTDIALGNMVLEGTVHSVLTGVSTGVVVGKVARESVADGKMGDAVGVTSD